MSHPDPHQTPPREAESRARGIAVFYIIGGVFIAVIVLYWLFAGDDDTYTPEAGTAIEDGVVPDQGLVETPAIESDAPAVTPDDVTPATELPDATAPDAEGAEPAETAQ